jgi:hypothetical protein
MTLNISMQNVEKTSTVEIYALDGRKLFSENFSELKHKVNVTALSKGTYLLKLFNDKKTLTTKFVR